MSWNLFNSLRPLYKSHWTEKASQLDMRSGLGDSAWFLYGICRSLKPAVAVEIGSARGKSACYIGMALKENGTGRLYAVDPHTPTQWNDTDSVDTYEIMCGHLKKLDLIEIVTILRQFSHDALVNVPTPIDLLFIDGDHSYDGVKSDWRMFTPHMSGFGVVVFHDTTWKINPDNKLYRGDMGVPQFVDELRQEGYPVLTINRDYGVSIVQPIKGGTPLTRATKAV